MMSPQGCKSLETAHRNVSGRTRTDTAHRGLSAAGKGTLRIRRKQLHHRQKVCFGFAALALRGVNAAVAQQPFPDGFGQEFHRSLLSFKKFNGRVRMHPWPSPRAGGCGSVRVRGRPGCGRGRHRRPAPDAALLDLKKTRQGREGSALPDPFFGWGMSAPKGAVAICARDRSRMAEARRRRGSVHESPVRRKPGARNIQFRRIRAIDY